MIILASQSPRRKEILTEILNGIPFETIPSQFNEKLIQNPDCRKLCLAEALGKANAVAQDHPNDIVIASDTMVLIHGMELGKPVDRNDALRMLRLLSGTTHEIITAYAIQKGTTVLTKHISEATLYIEKMAETEMEAYCDTGSPFDKAGAYGVQDKDFIDSKVLKGDYHTIMGLPKKDLAADLRKLGILKD